MSFEFFFPGPVTNPGIKKSLNDVEGLKVDEYDSLIPRNHRMKESIYLDVYRVENIGIILSYFCVGLILNLTSTPTYYYLVNVQNASSTIIGVLGTLTSLPWCFKVFFGLLSDSVPILDYRRKPYLFIGYSLSILSSLMLSSYSQPTIMQVLMWGFIGTTSLLLADVVTDTLCVERAKLETSENRGSLQTLGYTIRALGMVIGSILGAIVYNKKEFGWGLNISQIYFLNAIIPFVIVLPVYYSLVELAPVSMPVNFIYQLKDVWKTLQLRAVWLPMSFIYLYNVLQIPNVSFMFLLSN